MKKLIRSFCKIIGIKTDYMVTATCPLDDGRLYTLTCTCTVLPWLNDGNFEELLYHMQEKIKGAIKQDVVMPNITAITKLGI